MQPFIRALPLTALIDALRAIINEGRPLSALGYEMAVMLGWGSASYALAFRLFRWQ